jgi:hypothetical protein
VDPACLDRHRARRRDRLRAGQGKAGRDGEQDDCGNKDEPS